MDDSKLVKVIKKGLIEELLEVKEFDYEIDEQTDLFSLIHFYDGFVSDSEKKFGIIII